MICAATGPGGAGATDVLGRVRARERCDDAAHAPGPAPRRARPGAGTAAHPRRWCLARPHARGRRRHRGNVSQRARLRMDAQAGWRARPRRPHPRSASTSVDRRARGDRRHRRLPRARDRVVVGRRRRQRAGRHAARLQPRAGRQRPDVRQRARDLGAGVPHEAPSVRFSADLRTIAADDGSELRFHPRGASAAAATTCCSCAATTVRPSARSAARCRATSLWRVRVGVVEHHRARW